MPWGLNAYVRELITLVLEDEGFAVCCVGNGPAALATLTAVQPAVRVAVLILDMMLPGLEGAAVLAALPQQGVHVPVIALSASPLHLAAARAAGAMAALAEPFELQDLLALVERYCPPAAPPERPPAAD